MSSSLFDQRSISFLLENRPFKSNRQGDHVASFILHMFLYLESLAALDEIVGDAGEAVVGEVEHAQELQVLELAAEKERMLKG